MTYLNLLFINITVVLIWDIFNFPNEFASTIAQIITHNKVQYIQLKKPFGCSLCVTFWLSIVYTVVNLGFTFENLLFALFLSAVSAWLTKFTFYAIRLIEQFTGRLSAFLERSLNKII